MNETTRVTRERRWPGLLLSFFVPGFGLFRAGLPHKGGAWFVGVLLLNLILALSIALSVVPIWLVAVVLIVSVVAPIWMLCDGFRSGRMTWRLWVLFVGLFAFLMMIQPSILSVVRSFNISTGAMQPTLRGADSPTGADYIAVDLLSYRMSSPQRGDIIVFSTSGITGLTRFMGGQGDTTFVKRLVGMPGEKIRISEGKVFVDGRPLGDADGIPPFAYQNPRTGSLPAVLVEGEDFVVGSDEYFVLGDNTSNSLDSRFWGCVPKSSVLGKVTMIYYPFSRAGRIYNLSVQ
ncbi:MAG: signal peptidase I [Akkermansiaceae bacterium]|jgi:signal peptidase I|nr:signal peptidase I [Akkermansiaceae bacterium]MDP4645750.1 signal peptidase I [Akkermansiaceae bacterium]MDP4720591.1 signal peptidase I [Akkermansiaceae bacterium]MDP4781507.1 signal peptidase I [Akkermansiaceae bacterium]MDP4845902.1 signal peptidase I [Akkermansiaceae bacterium]